jgi:thiosulfate/3-mercaptopyruvate sulfurtransferase
MHRFAPGSPPRSSCCERKSARQSLAIDHLEAHSMNAKAFAFLLAVAALIAASAHQITVRASAPASASTPQASPPAGAGYAHPEWLADVAWLDQHLADPTVKIVALTPAEDFAKGHIPGAAQIDWPDLEIVETSDQAVATWRGAVEQKLTALGISRTDTVVVYDGGTFYAARLWWILVLLGHADVRILNGGYPAWTAAGGPGETGPSTAQPAPQPYVGTPDESAIATLAEVKAALDDSNVVFVDARSPQEYRAGHLPGAVNIEFTLNGEPDQPHYWKSAEDLRTLYAAAGVTPGKTVIPYCSTGVRSAATYFTLHLIGYEHVALFTGSWKEWSSHPELPVATGD